MTGHQFRKFRILIKLYFNCSKLNEPKYIAAAEHHKNQLTAELKKVGLNDEQIDLILHPEKIKAVNDSSA